MRTLFTLPSLTILRFLKLSMALLFLPATGFTQYFKVDTVRFEDPHKKIDYYDPMNNMFPEVVSEKHWKQSVLINSYLHADFLHVLPHTHGNPFEAISPAEGEMMGTTDIDFTIENNSSRIFSVAISADYTSAYSERFSLYYNFNAQTGEYITLRDLFTSEGLLQIQKQLVEQRVAEVKEFLSTRDTNEETGYEQYMLYTNCLPYIQESSVEYEQFILTDTKITFIHERCSNHAMRVIDDLDEFQNTLDLATLKPNLTLFGKELLYGKPTKAKSNPAYPSMKMMKGKIGKKLDVTFIMGRQFTNSPNNVSGMYFYDKEGNMIELSAELNGSKWSVIEYSGPNVRHAHMEGEYVNGVFKGKWVNDKDGRVWTIEIKLAHL